MQNRSTVSIAALTLTFGFHATSFAQSSSVSASSVQPAATVEAPAPAASEVQTTTIQKDSIFKNKKFEDDYTLTDAKLRADDGSLSRYSVKVNMSYYGPTVNDFSQKDQPNPNGSNGPYSTSIGGSVTARYRMNPDRTISMGTGIKAIHPMHGWDRTDVNTPFVSYDMASRWNGIQMRNSPGVSIVTVPEYTAVGEFASMNWDNSMVKDLGTSGFAAGLDSSFGYYFYNREYRTYQNKNNKGDGKANQYNISFYPNIKYNFSRTFSVNTSIGASFWNPRQIDNRFAIWNNMATVRLGFGYSVARDIYFAPYFNTYVDRMAIDTTTFNFSTIFSVL